MVVTHNLTIAGVLRIHPQQNGFTRVDRFTFAFPHHSGGRLTVRIGFFVRQRRSLIRCPLTVMVSSTVTVSVGSASVSAPHPVPTSRTTPATTIANTLVAH